MKHLILGAGGFLGLNLVDELVQSGSSPLCGSRRRAPRLALRRRKCQVVHADLDDPASLDEAMSGVEVVYHLAGHYPALSLDPDRTLTTGIRQTSAVLDAAARVGVRRLVYASTMATVAPSGSGGATPSTEGDVFDAMPGIGVYHDTKWMMEQLVLNEQRLEVTVACPGACIGPWDMRIGTSALLVSLARGLNPAFPEGRVNLVDVRDVAIAMTRLGKMDRPPRRVILAATNASTRALGGDLAARYGVAPPHMLSADDARALADAQEHRCAEVGGRPMLSREIVDLVTHGVVVDNALSRRALGLTYRPVEQTLDDFDAWARARRIIPTPAAEVLAC